LNDASNGFDIAVVIFANGFLCLLKLFSFCRKNQVFFQHSSSKASRCHSASCCLQPKVSYIVNIVASLLHQPNICETKRQIFCITFSAFRFFTHYFSILISLIFYSNQLHYLHPSPCNKTYLSITEKVTSSNSMNT
jgi:hypothetical protein